MITLRSAVSLRTSVAHGVCLLLAVLAVIWVWIWWTAPADQAALEQQLAAAVQSGNLPQSEQLLLQLRRLDPQQPDLLGLLVRVQLQQDRLAQALESLSHCSQPATAWETSQREAAWAMQRCRLTHATALYQWQILAHPDHAGCRQALIRLRLAALQGDLLRRTIAESVQSSTPNSETWRDLLLFVVGDRGPWDDQQQRDWLLQPPSGLDNSMPISSSEPAGPSSDHAPAGEHDRTQTRGGSALPLSGAVVHWPAINSELRSQLPLDQIRAAAIAEAARREGQHLIVEEIAASCAPAAAGDSLLPLIVLHAEMERESQPDAASVRRRTQLWTSLNDRCWCESRTWTLLSQWLRRHHQPERSLEAAEIALAIDPFSTAALSERARTARLLQHPQADRFEKRTVQVDTLSRSCLRQLQQATPDPEQLQQIADLAEQLEQTAWANRLRAELHRIAPAWVASQGTSAPLHKEAAATAENDPSRAETTPSALPILSETEAIRRSTPFRRLLQERIPTESPAATDLTAARQGGPRSSIRFDLAPPQNGLDFRYEYGHSRQRWLMETLGGGVAAWDYDRDGWDDLFFAQGGRDAFAGNLPLDAARKPHAMPPAADPTPSNRVSTTTSSPSQRERCCLYRNRRGTDWVAAAAPAGLDLPGYGHGVATADFDEDGFCDLLLCRYGGLALMRNCGDGTFQEVTSAAGLETRTWNTSATWADLDNDGDLDLFVAGYCHAPWGSRLAACREGEQGSSCRPSMYPAEPDLLYENLGDGRFAERSRTAGIDQPDGYGLGIIAEDFDGDGRIDLFVGNDTTPNYLFQNRGGNWTGSPALFEETGLASGVAVDGQGQAEACMGISTADVDRNGWPDLFVTNFHDETNTLYLNSGSHGFEDRTEPFGLSGRGRHLMGWGCQFLDADGDGWQELMIVNGLLHDGPQPPQIYSFREQGTIDLTEQAGEYFQQSWQGRGVAKIDFDRDQRIDLVVTHQVEPAALLRNATVDLSPPDRTGSDLTGANHSAADRGLRRVTLRLIGRYGPRDATGAIVHWRPSASASDSRSPQVESRQFISRQGGYLTSSTSDLLLTLPEGGESSLQIRWPGGKQQTVVLPAERTTWTVFEGADRALPVR